MTTALVLAIAFTAAAQSGAVEAIARDSMSGVDEPRQAAATTEGEWAALWRQHAPDKPLPKIDFTTRSVVAIFLGSRPTPGYDVEILGTKRDGDTVVVEWAEVRPQERLLLAQVLTSPALIATIPKPPGAGTIAFRKVTR
jgi:hypothetical protein